MKHWFKEAPPVGYLGTWDSVIWHPVAVIIWSQHPVHQKNNIHNPPDPHTSQSQQFPHCCAGVTETESVHSQESQEHGVDQGCHKVVPIVSSQNKYILVTKQLPFHCLLINKFSLTGYLLDAGKPVFNEGSIPVTLYSLQHWAHCTSKFNLFISLSSILKVAIKFQDMFLLMNSRLMEKEMLEWMFLPLKYIFELF